VITRLILVAALIAAPAAAQVAGPKIPITTITPPKEGTLSSTPARQPALPGTTTRKVDAPAGDAPRQATQNGVLVLYGSERCPTNKDGEEIVVCVRRAPGEQYRVPKELRELTVTPENQSWAAKADATLSAGAGGIGSCSPVGPGGASGCFAQAARANRAENADRAKEQRNIP
jgi:hypothetical protein